MKKRTPKARLIALVMTMLLMVSMLAACGGDETPADPATAIKEASSATFAQFATMSDPETTQALVDMMYSGNTRQEMSLTFTGAEIGMDVSELYGTEFSLVADMAVPDRKMAMDMTLTVGAADPIYLDAMIDDSTVYLASSSFLGDAILGVSESDMATTTGTSINTFDMLDQYAGMSGTGLTEESMTALSTAYDTMMAGATIADPVDAEIEIDGASLAVSQYDVSITPELYGAFVTEVINIIYNDEVLRALMEPSIELQYGDYDTFVSDSITSLEEQLALDEEAGDFMPTFYISDGYLRGVDMVVGDDLAMNIRFGAEVAADYFEMFIGTASTSEALLTMTAKGNHSGAGDKFDTVMEMSMVDPSTAETVSMNLAMDYDLASGAYNFNMDASTSYEAVSMSSNGTFTMDETSYSFVADDFTVESMGMSLSFAMELTMAESEGVSFDVSSAQMISEMSSSDMAALQTTLQTNAMNILMNVAEASPLIATLLMGGAY